MEEMLTYSEKQFKFRARSSELFPETKSTMTLTFYDGVQFTDRRSKKGEQSLWEDARVVFEGCVEETKITYEEVPRSFVD